MCCGLKINGCEVFRAGESETWSSSMLNQRILNKHGDEPIDALELDTLKQPTKVLNEELDTIGKRETAKKGYKKFHLNVFNDLEKPMEQSVVESTLKKLEYVQDFKVARMCWLPSEVNDQFVNLAATVLEENKSAMTDIDFYYLISDK